jgi:hypothetical protein
MTNDAPPRPRADPRLTARRDEDDSFDSMQRRNVRSIVQRAKKFKRSGKKFEQRLKKVIQNKWNNNKTRPSSSTISKLLTS